MARFLRQVADLWRRTSQRMGSHGPHHLTQPILIKQPRQRARLDQIRGRRSHFSSTTNSLRGDFWLESDELVDMKQEKA